MSYSRRSRYFHSPSPYKRYSRSISSSPSRSRSRDSSDAENPGNNLYVTGLSTRVSRRDLEKHFLTEGKVEDVRLVVDPWTQESRGFGFVTMSTVKEADRCVKNLDCSVLHGRVITVEKGSCVQQLFSKLTNQIKYNRQISDCYSEARRRRGRTPTPGRYLGLRTVHARRQSPTYSRSVSPCYSSEAARGRSRSYSPCYNRQRQSLYHRRRSYSPYYRRGRSYSRSRSPSYSRSPVSRRDRSYSPAYHKYYSPDERYYRRRYHSSLQDYSSDDCEYRRSQSWSRSPSRSISPMRGRNQRRYSRCISPRHTRRYSRSISPRRSRRRYSCSISPRCSRRSYSRSVSPKHYRRSYSRSVSPGNKHEIPGDSCRSSRSHSRSHSVYSTSQSG